MRPEHGILTSNEKEKLSNLLLHCNSYFFKNVEMLLSGEVKYFVDSIENQKEIYSFRMSNAENKDLKYDLQIVIKNLSVSVKELVRLSFIGPAEDRIIVFSDVDFDSFFGVVSTIKSKFITRNL